MRSKLAILLVLLIAPLVRASNWPDRRPMAFAQFQQWSAVVANAKGDAAVEKALFVPVSQSIARAKAGNAQAVIIWDSGEPDGMHYVGDPRMEFSPFTTPVKQYVYALCRAAGLKVGCTIRPGILVKRSDGTYDRLKSQTIADDLGAKADFARRNFGTTIYYVDSNLDDEHGGAINPNWVDALRVGMGFGDETLFICEYCAPASGGVNPSWTEQDHYNRTSRSISPELLDANGKMLDLRTLNFPPGGFACFRQFSAAVDPSRHDELVEMVRRGNIFMFRAQAGLDDPANAIVLKTYHDAGVILGPSTQPTTQPAN